MKDHIVSFKLAKVAKANGFKEYCPRFYALEEFYSVFQGRGATYEKGEIGDYQILEHGKPVVRAPTASLLQKWLRKKHNIDVTVSKEFIEHSWDNHKYIGYEALVSKANTIGDIISEEEMFNLWKYSDVHSRYDTAMEEGLEIALKMIENKEEES